MVSPRWGCRASHGDVKSVRYWGRVGRGYQEREREGKRGGRWWWEGEKEKSLI